VEKNDYSFEPMRLSNRLGTKFDVDVRLLLVESEQLIIVRANKHYHRSSVATNMEYIAFQLKTMFAEKSLDFSIVEYRDRTHKKGGNEEWWQWRFHWRDNAVLDRRCDLLSATKAEWFKRFLLNESFDVESAS
jgi:hypothetical protein